ncbi:hypothetical protein [Archangium primigenium]|uniref:hypothetical protein n=1 Tax=[Archangium] primigenium TaxID=2792470 RepID=UPI00195B7CEA|nr:hypothetical protein [Archangium primigenium]
MPVRAVFTPVVCLVLAGACSPSSGLTDAAAPPAVVMRGVRLRSFEGETPALSGQAERATYERNGELTATRATLRVPGRTPADVTVVSAALMEGHLGTRDLVASGDVEVRTGAGMVARTPRATYSGAEQRISGQEGVQVQAPDYRLRADTFVLSVPDARFTFEGSVHTVLESAHD